MHPPRALGLTLSCLTALLILATAQSVSANKRDFVWSYEWSTPIKFEKEIELWHTYRSDSDQQEGQLEFEYGVTDNWTVAQYLLYEKTPGTSWDVNGWKLETRYAFGTYAERRWLPAAYLELKKKEGKPHEFEAKSLWSFYDGARSYALNLIAEKELAPNKDWIMEWTAAVSAPFARDRRWTVEAFGNVDKGSSFVGPGLSLDLADYTRLNFNLAKGLNNRSDSYRARVLLEYEWF